MLGRLSGRAFGAGKAHVAEPVIGTGKHAFDPARIATAAVGSLVVDGPDFLATSVSTYPLDTRTSPIAGPAAEQTTGQTTEPTTAPGTARDTAIFAGNLDEYEIEGRGAQVGGSPLIQAAFDLNGDGFVDFSDYLEFLNLYDAQDPRADFNRDGFVDFTDYLEFLNLYDAGC